MPARFRKRFTDASFARNGIHYHKSLQEDRFTCTDSNVTTGAIFWRLERKPLSPSGNGFFKRSVAEALGAEIIALAGYGGVMATAVCCTTTIQKEQEEQLNAIRDLEGQSTAAGGLAIAADLES